MSTASEGRSSRYNRKSLLGRLGIGAAAAGTGGLVRTAGAGAAPAHGQRVYAASAGHFGRIFDRLPPFASQSPRVEAALRDLGKPGGILDARDALDKGPVLLITDPSLSANNPNNPEQTAGSTFVGQFLDHDMTFDVGSRLGHATEPRTAVNARTPAFDLDSVYGGGPVASPYLYDAADRAKLRIASGGHVRGPAPDGRRDGDRRRPPQRRARDHRGPPVRVHPVPQQRRRPRLAPRAPPTRSPRRGG